MVKNDCTRNNSQGEDEVEDFNQMYNRNFSKIFVLCKSILKNDMLAEEITNDVFIKLWLNWNSTNYHTSFQSYLFVSAKNKCFDELRKKKVSHQHIYHDDSIMFISDTSNPHLKMVEEQLYIDYDSTVNLLPPKCKMIFKMSREEGLKYKDIASELEISIKTVETQMGRALKQLRQLICQAS